MARIGLLGASVLAIGLSATAAIPQSSAVPAEFPPADFEGNQFVDSKGCAFIRAGVAGLTNWVPRVNRSRDQLCNFQPTFADAAPAPAAAPEAAPIIEITSGPPAPQGRSAVSGSRGVVGNPVETVASIPATPRPAPAPVRPPVPAPAPVASPRIITPEPAAAPEPPRITLAEACEGRFGIQPGFVSSRTGEPIDCGPAPAAIAAVPVPTVAPVAAAPEPARITLAQACEGRFGVQPGFISARTGEPIDCGPAPAAPQIASVAAPVAAPVIAPAAATVAAPAPVVTGTACANIPNLQTFNNLPVRCGPQQVKPYTEVASAPASRGTVSTRSAPLGLGAGPVPASNRTVARAAPARPPAGFEPAWNDGRINPQRGVQVSRSAAAPAQAAVTAPTTARVSTSSAGAVRAPAPQITGHRYVQVGSFGDPANATRLIQRLGSLGLPVASGKSGHLRIVAAGPFSDAAQLQRALNIVRGLGFTDAYTRN